MSRWFKGNKIQAHTRVRRAEIVQAAKPCAKRPPVLWGKEKKKGRSVRERAGDKETDGECACNRRERVR